MLIDLNWTDFKIQVINKGKLRFNDRDAFYQCFYGDFQCSIMKDSGADQTDFETNYKNYANKTIIEQTEITKQPDPTPFAQPTYRTKRNATASVLSVAPNSDGEVAFLITEERYISGGCLIVYNAQPGDYVVAEVEDIDGVIPVPYRAALCENHPVIAKYIEKEWVKADPNGVTVHEINTYPLNAKLSAGIYLCLHYYAANSGTARQVYINYYLTKKLV